MNNTILSTDLSQTLNNFFSGHKYSTVVVLADENTQEKCYPLIKASLPPHHLIVIKSGEEQKTLETCSFIWAKMTSLKLDRHALLINLGGGVIGDMGGFCASTYKRGIDFMQVPTTLLAQVDASIGGKLGVDFQQYKNHIGVFNDAEAVLIYTPFIQTLVFEEKRSGFAEIIKHCLIADKKMWEKIKDRTFEEQDLGELVPHSIQIKLDVVEADPLEKNIRKSLNFGHTIGHAVESYFLDVPGRKLLHGEAIAIGMICESYISREHNMLTDAELKEIDTFLRGIYPPVTISSSDYESIIFLTQQDKKNKDAQVMAALLNGIGAIKINVPLDAAIIKDSLAFYASR